MIENETGHLLKCVKLSRIENLSTSLKSRRTIAATSLKISCKNRYSVKSYDKILKHDFCIKSTWEKFSWGLTYFEEFSNRADITSNGDIQDGMMSSMTFVFRVMFFKIEL